MTVPPLWGGTVITMGGEITRGGCGTSLAWWAVPGYWCLFTAIFIECALVFYVFLFGVMFKK